MKESNKAATTWLRPCEVTNVNKDTKKLNAAVALEALGYLEAEEQLTEDQISQVASLCERLTSTPLYDDGPESNAVDFQHALKLIEEYLEEEGV